MTLETIIVGPLEVNCFILYDDDKNAMIIDPGDNGEAILKRIDTLGLSVKKLINTHGHFDHIGANGFLKEKTGAELLIHGEDEEFLDHADIAASAFGLTCEPSPPPDVRLKDGDVIETGSIKLEVIHTPGHSPGGISLLGGHKLFTGDTLFSGSVGRTDLVGGSHEELLRSIKDKLFKLGDTVEVYPGHGSFTTIGDEKRYNPFFK